MNQGYQSPRPISSPVAGVGEEAEEAEAAYSTSIPSVLQPVSAILFALVRKPGDFIITPDPDASRLRLPWRPADAPVVEFHQIRQVFALPFAKDFRVTPQEKHSRALIENRPSMGR